MPGPNAVGGPSRVPQQQPNVAPPAKQAPSLESRQDAAIDAMYSRSSTRPRVPAYAGQVKSAFGVARGSSSMAAAALSNDLIRRMAGRTPEELTRNFERAGLPPGDASAMAEAIGQRVGKTIRNQVRVRGHELIAQRREQLIQARDAITALQNAAEGTPTAAVYDALVERIGEEQITHLMEHFDEGLEALDDWDRRLDGQAWTLAELSDAARDVAPAGWLRDGTIASEQLERGTPFSDSAGELQEAAERVHLAFEVAEVVTELGHSTVHAAGSGIGAVFTAVAIGAHYVAHHYHEDFLHGMEHLFEEAR